MAEAGKKITVSEEVRQLHEVGMEVKEIAKTLGIRYQFAYNVVSQYKQEQALKATQQTTAATVMPVVAEQPAAPVVMDQPTPQRTIEMPAPFIAAQPTIPKTLEVGDIPAALPARKKQEESKASLMKRLFGQQ